jgi:splicing factor U2AF subunit
MTVIIATRILVMGNMVTIPDLQNDQDYREIVEDVESEARRYGVVKSVVVPRPAPPGSLAPPGLGKVFVEYELPEHSLKARKEVMEQIHFIPHKAQN